MMTRRGPARACQADASVTEGENITLHGDINDPADEAGTVTPQWCNDHYR
ncbi:hypothetical protein OK016_00215 [Vibrio chagasii]|nr:hypothetical protein [Vibrio chagasii]